MRRRAYLSAVAIAAVAGCSQITGDSGGPDYEDVERSEFLLEESDFPDEWVRNDQLNDNFDAVFTSEDESIAVLLSIGIHDTVDSAKEDYDSSFESFREPEEMSFADEAFWDTRNDLAFTIYRDSNLLGQAAALRESGVEVQPDQARAQQYSKDMYDHWQSLS